GRLTAGVDVRCPGPALAVRAQAVRGQAGPRRWPIRKEGPRPAPRPRRASGCARRTIPEGGMGLIRLSWAYTGSRHGDSTYFTPADRFYHVDHGGIPGPIAPESWRLRLGGRLARPVSWTWADLQARVAERGMVRFVKCLQCLRDPLGDDVEKRWYASSGLW